MRQMELLTFFWDLPGDPFARRLAEMLEDGYSYDELLEVVYEDLLVLGRGRDAAYMNGRWFVPIDPPNPVPRPSVVERLEAAREETRELRERLADVRARIADLKTQL